MGIVGIILLGLLLLPVAILLLVFALKIVGIVLVIGGVICLFNSQWIPGIIMLVIGILLSRIGKGGDDDFDPSLYWD